MPGIRARPGSCGLWEAQHIPVPSLVKYLPALVSSQRSSTSQPSQCVCTCPCAHVGLALRQHFCYSVFYLTRRKKRTDTCSPLPTHTSHSTAQLTLAPLKTNQYLTSHPSRVQSRRSSCSECGPEFLLGRWGCVSLTIPLTSGIVSTPAK